MSEDENYQVIDGVRDRKGTMGAALQNASILSSPSATDGEKTSAKKRLSS